MDCIGTRYQEYVHCLDRATGTARSRRAMAASSDFYRRVMETTPATLGGTGTAVAVRYEFIPAMLCHRSSCFPDEPDPPHRAKIADRVFPFNALVAYWL